MMAAVSGLLTRPCPASRNAKSRLRRVLYALDLDASQKFGSLEEQTFILARAFRERSGLFLPLYQTMPAPRGMKPYEQIGLPVTALDLRRFRSANLLKLLRLIAKYHIEVVHWNFYPPLKNAYVWLLTFLTPRVKHYFTDHNSRIVPLIRPVQIISRFVKSVFLKRYGRVVGVSQFVVDCLERQQMWSHLSCCLHFINTERFTPDDRVRDDLRRRLNVRDRFVLLTVAHLIEAKGVDVVLEALRELPKQVVLWVVGGGPKAERLRQLSDELGLRERVRFTGLRSRVEPYMQAADCFVCPSRWAEAAGLVCVEAQACGLPVVASNIGGIPEYVADQHTGFLFPPGDAKQLAERVHRLLGGPAVCQRMGQRARQNAVDRFSAAARLDDFLDLYRCSK